MEREWTTAHGGLEPTPRSTPAEFSLPSRAAARAAVRAALLAQAGPVLITGEPGTGKTWLCRQLIDEIPSPWRWLAIDATPSDRPAELYRAVGYALGVSAAADLGSARLAIADVLRETAADGARWVLVVDEAHNLSVEVLEELRVLANRLGAPGGFAGLVLAGQTGLAGRLAFRPLHAMASRLSARLHLRSLDIEEARALLAHLIPDRVLDAESLELLHRDAVGNPRTMLALASGWTGRMAPALRTARARKVVSASRRPRSEPSAEPHAPPARVGPAWPSPALAASKPPIREEEGLIEVGWTPPAEVNAPEGLLGEVLAPDDTTASDPLELGSPAPSPPAEELIDDHYAALQAWGEWARNQGRDPSLDHNDAAGAEGDAGLEAAGTAAPLAGHPGVWAEGQHTFAPYSQLFSRLRQKGSK